MKSTSDLLQIYSGRWIFGTENVAEGKVAAGDTEKEGGDQIDGKTREGEGTTKGEGEVVGQEGGGKEASATTLEKLEVLDSHMPIGQQVGVE